MDDALDVRRGISTALDPEVAAAEIAEAVGTRDRELVLFFCSASYDLPALAAALRSRFGSTPLLGCTTAGEIGDGGYRQASISAVSFAGGAFIARTVRIDDLARFEIARGESAARDASQALARATLEHAEVSTETTDAKLFGLLLSDGLSMQEEALVSAIYGQLGVVPIAGGSAADGTRFGATFVYHEGEFRSDCALFTLVRCPQPFDVFKTEHFRGDSEKLVVTGADPARRIVTEINGEPAGREFARAVGLEVTELTPMVFACHPVVVRIGGNVFVRSIQKVNDDESLTFFCAIDEGIVLTVAKASDIVDNLSDAFEGVRERIGPPEVTLGFDCILRRLELDQRADGTRLANILSENRVTGFATYGEQFHGMHVNQTFTAIAIGKKRAA